MSQSVSRRLKKFIKGIIKPKISRQEEYFYVHYLENIPEVKQKRDFEIRLIKEEELPMLKEIWPSGIEKLTKRLHNGDRCYVTFLDGKIAGYQWVQSNGMHQIQQANTTVEINTGDFWIYHARVAEWARGNGINTQVKRKILIDYKNEGFKRALIYTNSTNIPNQKGLGKIGFELLTTLKYLVVNNRIYPQGKLNL